MNNPMKQKLLASLFYILPHHAISWVMFKSARIQWSPLKNFNHSNLYRFKSGKNA